MSLGGRSTVTGEKKNLALCVCFSSSGYGRGRGVFSDTRVVVTSKPEKKTLACLRMSVSRLFGSLLAARRSGFLRLLQRYFIISEMPGLSQRTRQTSSLLTFIF